MYESVEVWVSMRRTLRVTMEADTYHDFRRPCAVGVMYAVSTPRWFGPWVSALRQVQLLQRRLTGSSHFFPG